MAKNTGKNTGKNHFDLSEDAIRPFYAGLGAADLAFEVMKDYLEGVSKRLSSASDDVTHLVDGLQKNVAGVAKGDPKELAQAVVALVNERFSTIAKDAQARQESLEKLISDFGKQYKDYPGKAKGLLDERGESASKTYEDLAGRGESVVEKLRGQDATSLNENITGMLARWSEAVTKVTDEAKDGLADVVDDVKGAAAKAASKKPAQKKAPAKKSATKKTSTAKASATKTAATKAPAKKAPAKKATAKAATAKAGAAKAATPKPAAKKTTAVKKSAAKKAPATKKSTSPTPAVTATSTAPAAVTPPAPSQGEGTAGN